MIFSSALSLEILLDDGDYLALENATYALFSAQKQTRRPWVSKIASGGGHFDGQVRGRSNVMKAKEILVER